MNTYKITFTNTDTGKKGEDRFTDSDEKEAKKSFRTCHRQLNYTIDSIELIDTGVMASKQQERDALAAIKKMVEDLGPQSYLATAFAGCFEIAEQNIEYDFGDSMQGRCEFAQDKLVAAQEEAAKWLREAEERKQIAEAKNAELQAEVERLKIENDALTTRIPTEDDLSDCISIVKDRASEHESRMSEAAVKIIEFAGKPESSEFQQAVKEHRSENGALDYCKSLQQRLMQSTRAGA